MKTQHILLTCLMLSSGLSLRAGDDSVIFTDAVVDNNPVTAAMAGASLTNIDAATAWGAFTNPSLAVFSDKKMGISATWQNWMPEYDGSDNISLASGFKIAKKISVSLAGTYVRGAEYELVDNYGISAGTYEPYDLYLALGLGVQLSETLSFGANVKYLSSDLAESASYSGYAASVLATWHKGKVTASAGVLNLGPECSGYKLPTSAAVSGACDIGQKHRLHLELDANYYFAGGFSAALGAQYDCNDFIFIRAGYRLSEDTSPVPSHFAAGLGIKLIGIKLNASYILSSDSLKNSFAIGIGYPF